MKRILIALSVLTAIPSISQAQSPGPIKPLSKVEKAQLDKVMACTNKQTKTGVQYEVALVSCDPTGRFSQSEEAVGYDIHPDARKARTVRCDFKAIGPVIIQSAPGQTTMVTWVDRTTPPALKRTEPYARDYGTILEPDTDEYELPRFNRTSKGLQLTRLPGYYKTETVACALVSK